jgi:hypothetical protein
MYKMGTTTINFVDSCWNFIQVIGSHFCNEPYGSTQFAQLYTLAKLHIWFYGHGTVEHTFYKHTSKSELDRFRNNNTDIN